MKISELMDALENYMETEGVSQKELSLKLGWTPAAVNDLLKGRSPLGIKRALHIAKTLGLRFEIGEEVLGETVPPPTAKE